MAYSYFECALERTRRSYGMCVYGYVVMPEHVHLLVSEPEREVLAPAMQSLKQSVAHTLALRAKDPFWQARYYDFNVWSEKKFVEKLRYIHRNPVVRGLVKHPKDLGWASRPLFLELSNKLCAFRCHIKPMIINVNSVKGNRLGRCRRYGG